MKRNIMALFLALSIIFINTCFAANLNDSVQKQITVKSEIQRGFDAVLNANRQAAKTGESIDDLVYSILNKNQQDNTDTEPFKLGVYFSIWNYYSTKVNSESISFNDPQEALRNRVRAYYVEFKTIQNQLKLDNETICDVVGVSYEKIQTALEAWEIAVEK